MDPERDFCLEAILINTKPVGKRDYAHAFLTPNGLEHIMEPGGQKRGTRAFQLFSQGTVYLRRREGSDLAMLRDSRAERVRGRLITPEGFLALMPFAAIMTRLGSKGADGFFGLSAEALDLLDNGADASRVLANYIERVLCALGFVSDFVKCPLCDRLFDDRERLGYNVNASVPVCEGCADEHPWLLPGMRRYLAYTRAMSLTEAVGVDVSGESIARIREYERKRLDRMNVRI